MLRCKSCLSWLLGNCVLCGCVYAFSMCIKGSEVHEKQMEMTIRSATDEL